MTLHSPLCERFQVLCKTNEKPDRFQLPHSSCFQCVESREPRHTTDTSFGCLFYHVCVSQYVQMFPMTGCIQDLDNLENLENEQGSLENLEKLSFFAWKP